MHELSISLRTVDIVVEQAKKHHFRKVTAMTLGIGSLSCIEPEALRVGIEFASRETIAESARVQLDMIPATAWCHQCQKKTEIHSYLSSCPYCNSEQLRIETGEELKIKSIEAE
ncbi:hydrogenase nickel incorporation protein HybF [Vibrio aerogenes CECT 7868]|uniref:Hydrogenase maturation factor HypA n=1 Tax=Vibrio aerogenes CECT 7868 TaxID=1216006 RepID=A0A1M5YNA7_9VIBR|nr:hydrogenase maturation nickel metallochaperone HypA [Vibrio aerogenes]SHI13314.1 hydrogenase nickel incorporation protein HybF [Vibrio aerogenes CECT 7868]